MYSPPGGVLLTTLRPYRLRAESKRCLEKILGARQQAKLMSTNSLRLGAGLQLGNTWQQLTFGAEVTPSFDETYFLGTQFDSHRPLQKSTNYARLGLALARIQRVKAPSSRVPAASSRTA